MHGEIPDGLFICHHCDNPTCVRPDHLFLGTPKDNMRDSMVKGRREWAKGVDHKSTKLTAEQAFRAKFGGEKIENLARELGVVPRTIRFIRENKSWKHI
jgi:hypothetical protein